MFKAMALICAAWIANGQAKQACFTHMFDWEFETKRECQMRLIYYRAKELPHYHNIFRLTALGPVYRGYCNARLAIKLLTSA